MEDYLEFALFHSAVAYRYKKRERIYHRHIPLHLKQTLSLREILLII